MQTKAKTIAVVMAAYNSSRFIDEALASLASETRLPDEVVIIDDASQDDTVARASRWCNRLPLRVLRSEVNAGAGAARVRAMRHVNADLVTFLDADDVLLGHHLEQLEADWQTSGGIVSPRALLWRPGQVSGDYHRALGVAVPRRHQLSRLLARNYVFYGALFSRVDYERVGGLRPARLSEDWDLWVRMSAAGVPITVTDSPSVLYRRHATNLTQDTDAVERGVAALIEQYHDQHPEWLTASEWSSVRRQRRALQSGHRGLTRLRGGDVSGVVDLGKAANGRWPTVEHLGRKIAYRVWRAANHKPTAKFT